MAIFTCRFCRWRSIFPEKIKSHVDVNHPVINLSLEVYQVQGGAAIKREDLERLNVFVSGPNGYESFKMTAIPNSCRFCSFRSKKPEEMKEHLDEYHPAGLMDVKSFRINGEEPFEYAIMKEDMEKLHLSIR